MSGGIPAYAYNASASGFGGILYRGNLKTVVPTIASVCLSQSGGDASVCYENYYRDDISFSRAEARVSGGEAPALFGVRRHITYSEVYLRDLRIFDRISIALMQATMTSTREIIDAAAPMQLEHDRTTFDIHILYRGVELDGVPVGPDVDIDLCSARTYGDFADMLLNRPDCADILASGDPGLTTEELVALKGDKKPFVGPLVRGIAGVPEHRGKGPHVRLDKFGKVKFGQLLVTPDKQRYNLLRLELDGNWTGQKQSFFDEPPADVAAPIGNFGDATPIASTTQFMLSASSGDGGGSLSGGGGGSNGVPTYP